MNSYRLSSIFFFSDLSNIIENVITLKSSLHKLLAQEVREEGLAGPQAIATSLWIETPAAGSALSLSRSFRTGVLHQLGKYPGSRGETQERDGSLAHNRQLQHLQACFDLYTKYLSMHVFEPTHCQPQWVELF